MTDSPESRSTEHHLGPEHRRAPGNRRIDQPDFVARIDDLITECGGRPDAFDGRLIRDMIVTALKLITDERGTGELKLLSASLKELRHAYRVFAEYAEPHKISIFGSARTPATHPDYLAAVEFSRIMAQRGWLAITGAGDGIMKAGHEGPGRESSFGLAIRLPFETTANTVIAGDDKLIHFRYFFTRKLIFLSQCEAVAGFPGGFGTHDELLEVLTLVQTGKSHMVPVVLIEGPDSTYWSHWDRYIREELLKGGFISPEDPGLYYLARTPEDAADHVCRFYANYHSSRYVNDDLVIRIKRRLTPAQVERLNEEFAPLIAQGRIVQRGPYDTESELLELPRIAFTHTRRHIGLIRRMIDRVNDFALGAA
ncbi:MAG TPA: LOG family protein [Phycisphaerales bacterium]|nr:LOG family protein [Phycisphaerales bacterium]